MRLSDDELVVRPKSTDGPITDTVRRRVKAHLSEQGAILEKQNSDNYLVARFREAPAKSNRR